MANRWTCQEDGHQHCLLQLHILLAIVEINHIKWCVMLITQLAKYPALGIFWYLWYKKSILWCLVVSKLSFPTVKFVLPYGTNIVKIIVAKGIYIYWDVLVVLNESKMPLS